jgi:hypothetical protein
MGPYTYFLYSVNCMVKFFKVLNPSLTKFGVICHVTANFYSIGFWIIIDNACLWYSLGIMPNLKSGKWPAWKTGFWFDKLQIENATLSQKIDWNRKTCSFIHIIYIHNIWIHYANIHNTYINNTYTMHTNIIHTHTIHTYIHNTCIHTQYIHAYTIHTYIHITYIHTYIQNTYIHTYIHTQYIHSYTIHTQYLQTYYINGFTKFPKSLHCIFH